MTKKRNKRKNKTKPFSIEKMSEYESIPTPNVPNPPAENLYPLFEEPEPTYYETAINWIYSWFY